MPKLPVVSGRETIRALLRAGFVVLEQTGSHVTMSHPATGGRATVPSHGGRDLPTGTLRAILRGAKLTADEFRGLLQ